MSFKTVHFVPASEKHAILALPVYHICAVAHEQQANTNHWCFYLHTGTNTSVSIDCTPSFSVPSTMLPGGSKANMIISRLSNETLHGTVKVFKLAVKPNLTVADIYDALIQNGRHKYEFDANGVGCRWWVSGQLDLLKEKQIVTSSQEVAVSKDAISKLWPEGTPLALDQGAYYQ